MEVETVVVNIGEMIDLAIGTPELGVVDFCMLQTVLHCIAQQLRISNKNVELRGAAASLPVGRAVNIGETIKINEFIVQADGVEPSETPDTMLIVDRIHKETGAPKILRSQKKQVEEPAVEETEEDEAAAAAGAAGAEAVEGEEQVTDLEAVGSAISGQRVGPLSSSEKLSLVTLSKFNVLQTAVEDLKNRVYGSMPKNEAILEDVRSQTNLKAITDMWTSLNVSSRLEATEQGIAKLSSLLQDIVGKTSLLNMIPQTIAKASPGAGTGVKSAVSPAQPNQTQDGTDTGAAIGPPAVSPQFAQSMTIPGDLTEPSRILPYTQSTAEVDMALVAAIEALRDEHEHLYGQFQEAMKSLNVKVEPPSQSAGARRGIAWAPGSARVAGTGGGPGTGGGAGAGGVSGSPSVAGGGFGLARSMAGVGADAANTEKIRIMNKRLSDLEEKLQQVNKIIFGVDGNIQDQVTALHDQVEHYTKQVSAMEISSGRMTPDMLRELQGLMGLFKTVQDLQGQLHQVYQTSQELATEKDDRQLNINALLEQIELLKTIKLDREDMVEALADKADLRMLARKVSHDQFEMACDDLSIGLEHALGKLSAQESLWQQALDDINREIETKLDKVELTPVRDFFSHKLRQLQENLKQLISLRRETEAAGTKKKLLNDVNCISCDAQAFMKMEPGEAVPPKPLQPTKSMKPYLTYELDAIRKTQASSLSNRNMHDWEKIDKQMTPSKQPQRVRSDTDKHICNRYCGGSHTTTTPAQRVARLGHFIKQWGPEVLPLSSKFATGDDGRLYKVCDEETKPKIGPGGAVDAMITPRQTSQATPAPQPVKKVESKGSVAKECRCLDERLPKN